MNKLVLLSLFVASIFLNGCTSTTVTPNDAPKNVKTYLIAPYESLEAVRQKLQKAGFTILTVTESGKHKFPNVVFTNPYIQSLANRTKRGFLAGELRLLLHQKQDEIRLQNPLYFMKAFMQEEYEVGMENPVVESLLRVFPNLSPDVKEAKVSNDAYIPYEELSSYRYSIGMPRYHNQNVIAEAKRVDTLLQQLYSNAKNDILYTIKLSDERYVFGLKPSMKTERFTDKIGSENGTVLPWQLLIELREKKEKEKSVEVAQALILDGKYRIALSYPLTSMIGKKGFESIVTIPDQIVQEMKNIFEKDSDAKQ